MAGVSVTVLCLVREAVELLYACVFSCFYVYVLLSKKVINDWLLPGRLCKRPHYVLLSACPSVCPVSAPLTLSENISPTVSPFWSGTLLTAARLLPRCTG